MDTKIETVELQQNQLKKFLVIGRRIKGYEAETGPVEIVRLVVDCNLQFKVYVYMEVVEAGSLMNAHDITSLVILHKLNDENYFICPGVNNYSTYHQSIGFNPTSVVHVALPTNSVRHTDCSRICTKSKLQKMLICKSCLLLKYYLTRQKRNHDAMTCDDRKERQKYTSSCPFDYLSPYSKKIRLESMRKGIHTLKLKLWQAYKKELSLQLNDDQGREMAELIRTISNSETGRHELEQIFNDAEMHGEGKDTE